MGAAPYGRQRGPGAEKTGRRGSFSPARGGWLALFPFQGDGTMLGFKLLDALADQIQNLSVARAPFVAGDIVELVVQGPVHP